MPGARVCDDAGNRWFVRNGTVRDLVLVCEYRDGSESSFEIDTVTVERGSSPA